VTTAAIVLAAGRSARLGAPKQLVEVGGEPLVRRAARLALEAGCSPVVVVEGATALASALDGLAVERVACPEWEAGPGASLARGASAVATRASRVLVLLVDQYRVDGADLAALLAAPGDVAAAAYGDSLGVPARFGEDFLAVLSGLPKDRGAKPWLLANRARVTAVPMPNAGFDLDHPEDLARAGASLPGGRR
jgi:CTP:molybdopterin cytidylyltransferase MocA